MFPSLYHSLIQHLFGGQMPSLSATPPMPQGQVNAPGIGATIAPQINAPGQSMTTMPQNQGFINAPTGPVLPQRPANIAPAPYYRPTVQSLMRTV